MRYRKYELASLARDQGRCGQRRAITPEVKEILEALALQTQGDRAVSGNYSMTDHLWRELFCSSCF